MKNEFIEKPLTNTLGSISNCHLKNSNDLLTKLRTAGHKNKTLASFDVISLFTNIPRPEALAVAKRVIEDMDDNLLPLPKDDFMTILKRCLSLDTFTFNDSTFQQHRGLAMGSPLSPILACLFMESLESSHFTNIIGHHNTWLRYVDDILVIVPRRTDLHDTLNRLNTVNPSIQFTLEIEQDGRLPFLDVLIMRQDSGYNFTVYRKPTDRDNHIHFYSAHSDRTKSGIVIGFLLRAHRICTKDHLQNEIDHITNSFLRLQYPLSWLLQRVSKAQQITTNTTTKTQQAPTNPPPRTSRLIVPTSQAAEKLKPLLHETGTQLVLTTSTRIKDAIQTKRPQQLRHPLSVVYNIPCGGCDHTYVGETGRGLNKRLKEHKTDMKNMTTSNAMVQHTLKTGHRPNWDAAHILHSDMDKKTRKALETAEIMTRQTMNNKTGNSLWAPQIAKIITLDWLPK